MYQLTFWPAIINADIFFTNQVRCEFHEDGCTWSGELRDIREHVAKCLYGEQRVALSVVRDLSSRVSACERMMAEKDERLVQKDEEINELKVQASGLQNEVKGWKNEVGGLQNEVGGLRVEVNGWKNQVEMLTNEQQQMRNEIATLSKKLSETLSPTPSSSAQNVVKNKVKNEVKNKVKKKVKNEVKNVVKNVKHVVMERRRGKEEDVAFSLPDNHRIEFGGWSTVSAANIYVGDGMKVWYEVELVGISFAILRIGWASDSLTYIHETTKKGVGDFSESYAFNPVNGSKWCEGKESHWGEQITKDNSKKYVGVAIDLMEGTISFSLDGNWEAPMGIAFHGINKKTSYFPAISAKFRTVEINVGDRPFVYGPPDAGYLTLVDIV